MMTQSVMAQAAIQFGNAAAGAADKGKQSGNGFQQLIDSSLKAARNTSGNITGSTSGKINTGSKADLAKAGAADKSVQASDTKKCSDNDKTAAAEGDKNTVKAGKNTVQTDASRKTDQNKEALSDQSETTEKTTSADAKETDGITVNDQIMSQITAMLQAIEEAVMKTLNLTPEQLNDLLTSQGMSTADLLEPEKLQQLILANSKKTDILAALTDEKLADTMKQLLQTVEEIKAAGNVELTGEQIKSILSQAEEKAKPKTEASKEPTVQEQKTQPKEDVQEQSEVVNTANVTEDNRTKTVTKTDMDKNFSAEITNSADTQKNPGEAHSDTGSMNQNDLTSSNQFQTFVDKLANASESTQIDFGGEMTQVTQIRDIANQIIERVKVSVMPNKTSMELQLNPENLGKVNLSVQSKNGEMTAHFVVQNELSKEAIESSIQNLRDTLNEQGIKVDTIEVTVSANAFDQNSRESSESQAESKKESSGKKLSLEEAMNMTEDTQPINSTPDITGITGSTIDYTA
jgi:flagellar hook-length control protein FliK